MKKMKLLLLSLCVLAFGCILSGCGVATKANVTFTSSTKANMTLEAGYDDEMIEGLASMSNMSSKKFLKKLKASAKKSGTSYEKKKINGVTYHMFTQDLKNAKLSTIQDSLTDCGLTNVCLTNDYFYAVFDPEASGTLSSSDASAEMNIYINVKITFNEKVASTNCKLSNKSKTISMTIKDASKKKTFYASTEKVTKTAKAATIKEGKTYTAGKKITVSNQNSLAKMQLDGKTIKPNTKITKKGTHTLSIWSKNGKFQTISFKIK